MTRDDLRGRIAEVVRESIRIDPRGDVRMPIYEISDRIVEIVRRTQPKLEWRDSALFIGSVEFGHYTVYGSANVAAIGNGLGCDRWIGTFRTIKEARAAVEDAVRKALGWTND